VGTFFSMLVCVITDSKEKKICSLCFAEYIGVLLSTEAMDLIAVSAHLIHDSLTSN